MKSLSTTFLPLLFFMHIAHGMEPASCDANNIPSSIKQLWSGPAILPHCNAFDEGDDDQMIRKPDLMPQKGKDLIALLNNHENPQYPDCIFFDGPPQCGKSTLMNQLTKSIGADPLPIDYNLTLLHWQEHYAPRKAIIDELCLKFFDTAVLKAEAKQCAHAVIIFTGFDNLDADFNAALDFPYSDSFMQMLFYTKLDTYKKHILILVESAHKANRSEFPTIENIKAPYPSSATRKELAAYFLRIFFLSDKERIDDNASLIAQNTFLEPISQIREAARICAFPYLKKTIKTPVDPVIAVEVEKE